VTRAAVLGAGSWGTAFGAVLCDAGTDTVLWARRGQIVEAVTQRHENPQYLPGVVLPPGLRATADPAAALAGADYAMLALPSQSLRDNLVHWVPLLPEGIVLVSLMKGVELSTAKRMSEVVREVTGLPAEQVAVITGPNLAREIANRQPAASVVGCVDEDVAVRVQHACNSGYFRPYTNTDVVGCELGGAVKNVIALAVGMAIGLGLGDNSRASLITRGLAETARLGEVLGADPLTFSGLAGLGDLVATCSSALSRNRTFGENLGRGMTVGEVVAITRQTAEGVTSCHAIRQLARRQHVDMPIVDHVAAVVSEEMTVQEMVRSLLSRDPRSERRAPHE
jgi:glycerol-3-phosphate dehydrogenase (NAD(P)+)